ncbi:hypothetical protein EVAR_79058_1 [Eumeta japonica]|uniref:Uncharacterized protein n=1 Tax=Eumeta variegata TaxID=151549 RepID=A0A4C1XUR4_EUMVA|nr:hypothetical protein EVAR_79058_1 [Eumeta japonica]
MNAAESRTHIKFNNSEKEKKYNTDLRSTLFKKEDTHENRATQPVKYNTLTEYRREVRFFAVAFHPLSESSFSPPPPSPYTFAIDFPSSDFLFLPKRPAMHR